MRAAIISISSDIGSALAARWVLQGWAVAGTYRTPSDTTHELARRGVTLVPCDLDDPRGVDAACAELGRAGSPWDVLVVCPATLEPIGEFAECRFDEWATSIGRNFVAQMRCIHALLPFRNRERAQGASVICWAGGGVNGAPKAFSAYTVSKIAQIKMIELLDAEIPDVRFAILGPGWVRTKIHDATLQAGERAGATYDMTSRMLDDEGSPAWTDVSRVVACCDWVVGAERDVVGGRNISVASDAWETPELSGALLRDPDMYKLRRHGNDWRRPAHARRTTDV